MNKEVGSSGLSDACFFFLPKLVEFILAVSAGTH